MNFSVSTQDIVLVFHTLDLHAYIKQVNCYGIYRGGDDYEVFTEGLPEIYILKRVSQDLFEWRDDSRILVSAVNLFNSQHFPVRAIICYDTMAFMLNVEVVSVEHLSERIHHWLDLIEQALDRFGQACAQIVHKWEQDNLDEMSEQLSNPNPDSPWLKGQKGS